MKVPVLWPLTLKSFKLFLRKEFEAIFELILT